MRMKISVLDIMIDCVTMQEAVDTIQRFIDSGKPHLIATANAEMVMFSQQDRELADILNHADLVVPDGAGVVWAARYQGAPMPERVAGYDLAQRLLALSAQRGHRVFMFGGAPGVAEKAKAAAEKNYPGLQIAGTRSGFFSPEDEAAIINEIREAEPAILLAALGVPKQEKWLQAHLSALNVPICMGVGGTFDVMAGNVRRAPVWMQRANLEWLFRLLNQPSRAIRMLALPRFVLKVMGHKKH